jgi:hypothetical protein
MAVAIKRVYDKPDPSDGFRILVDRLWPHGVSKERASLDKWLKDVAPARIAPVPRAHGGTKHPRAATNRPLILQLLRKRQPLFLQHTLFLLFLPCASIKF